MAVPPPSPTDNAIANAKAALRWVLRARRDDFVAAGCAPIAPLPTLIELIERARCITAYIATGSEADPAALLAHAAASSRRTALPHVTCRTEPMRFLAWRPGDRLDPGPFGLLQPPADAPELVPDLMLVPLIGFDAALNRLGQGGGFYDRAAERWPSALRIGVAWSIQQVAAIPVEPWDRPLDAVITEREWITRL